MGTPIYSTTVQAEKYKQECLEYMRKLKTKGYKIYTSEFGTCDPTNMTINISPMDADPLLTLMRYWRLTEERYKQGAFKLAFTEFEKETK